MKFSMWPSVEKFAHSCTTVILVFDDTGINSNHNDNFFVSVLDLEERL